LAALRLMTNSNLVGCATRRLAGLSRLRVNVASLQMKFARKRCIFRSSLTG
jgi:hypothetical protein